MSLFIAAFCIIAFATSPWWVAFLWGVILTILTNGPWGSRWS
jgi:hypothetical protein